MNISTPTGGAKYFAIDNFQIQAVGPSVATAAIASNHPIAGNGFQFPSITRMTSMHVSERYNDITLLWGINVIQRWSEQF